MSAGSEDFSDLTALPGHVTFSVLDLHCSGHSVSVAAKEYPGVVRATKIVLSKMNRAAVFKGAFEIIRRNVGCDGNYHNEDDGLFFAFISALLKHPDKRIGKKTMAGIRACLKREGGAHVILIMAVDSPSVWIVCGPRSDTPVH